MKNDIIFHVSLISNTINFLKMPAHTFGWCCGPCYRPECVPDRSDFEQIWACNYQRCKDDLCAVFEPKPAQVVIRGYYTGAL